MSEMLNNSELTNEDDMFETPASKTLLIPLIVKAREGKQPRSLFRDRLAEAIVSKLPNDSFDFKMHPFMSAGTSVRVRYFDDIAKNFFERAEKPVLVQLGCGLDCRLERIGVNKGLEVNIDLPEVIEQRNKILPQDNEKSVSWSGNLSDRDWMDRLEQEYAGSNFIFMSEGVLMYLSEDEVSRLFMDIAERFPGSELVFDTVGKVVARSINKKSAVRELNASINWIYDNNGSMDKWHPALHRQDCRYYFDLFKSRWGLLSLMRFTPMGKSSAMFHYKIAEKTNG